MYIVCWCKSSTELIYRCSIMVVRKSPKLRVRVQFFPPMPIIPYKLVSLLTNRKTRYRMNIGSRETEIISICEGVAHPQNIGIKGQCQLEQSRLVIKYDFMELQPNRLRQGSAKASFPVQIWVAPPVWYQGYYTDTAIYYIFFILNSKPPKRPVQETIQVFLYIMIL